MRLIFWVTAVAVLSIAWAKNTTTKTKPKRQLDNIRSAQNLQYSLVLPNSRVAHFRSLNNNRRIAHGAKGGKLPPYAVQMEPVVQYSQKDPLYDPNQDNLDDSVVNQNQIYAQSKILNTQDSFESFGPPYGSLSTAPLYSHDSQPQYYDTPEPIIEIIIKESNETLPAPPPPPVQKKKKEPVHVFYVKYSKDPHSHDKVIYEKPIPAITPATNEEDDEHHHHQEYVTVTPEPYIPRETTTLRAIIKPESEVYHSDSSVKITFGNEGRHYSDRREGNNGEDREETAPRPAIAFPNQSPQQNHPPLDRAASLQSQYSDKTELKSTVYHPNSQTYRQNSQHAQSRIQFQPQAFPTEQQLPRQNPTAVPFRTQSLIRHPFGSSPSLNPTFANGPPGIVSHFGGPTLPTPVAPSFQTTFPRPNSGPSFNARQNNPPLFNSRPQLNGPPRASFHSGPQRPFHQPQPQSKPFFDEAKYLQENYHTITTEQVDPPKEQVLPSRQPPTFSRLPQLGPSPTPSHFQDHFNRPQIIPHNQQLPQQRPLQHFVESKPSVSQSSGSSPFFNLKPSPPHIESNRHQFQSSQQFSFHQGPHTFPGPSPVPSQQGQHTISSTISSPSSSIPQSQFLPQPSSPPLYNFQPQPSPTPEFHFHRQNSPSERPQFIQQGPSERTPFYQTQGPSERPTFSQQSNIKDQSNLHHQQNFGQLIPHGGELIPAIPKYEQHITVNGPTAQTEYNLLNEPRQPSPTPSNEQQYHQQQQQHHKQQEQQHHEQREQQYREQQQQQQHQEQREQQHREQQQQQREQKHQQQQDHLHQQQHRELQQQREQQQQQHQQQLHQQHLQQQQQQQQAQQQQVQQQQAQQQQVQQQQFDAEQEQVRQQLAQNVQKQQEEIQRLQAQLYLSQQHQESHIRQYNQQIEGTSPRSQYVQERSRYQSSTSSPPYYQSTSRTVEIKPSTQKYVSSTANSIGSTPEPKKEEKKKPTYELPDEVPDDLRQHLLSSGILDNADISVLDYDKVGETPLESLPPDQLANFFSAGGAQQISASENRPIYVKPDGDQIESRLNDDDMQDDQEISASENIPSYVVAPTEKQAVEMKVVHFNPNTAEGQKIAEQYVKDNATQVEPVALNDKKYNRYLPLKVSGNQFPLPDVLKGRKVTSVVVLAPVETEALNREHERQERSTSSSLKGIKFIAGDSLQDLLKKPTKDNFEKWLTVEKKTAADLQSIILLVTGNETPEEEREIFMYDIASGNVNKLSGELSNAFVEAAENNSLNKNIDSLAIEGEGIPENFQKDDAEAEGSENVPLFVDLSGISLDDGNSNSVSISSSYSKTKLGRSLRRKH